MNIPNLPTDNLYKFISIFGMIIFFGGALLFYRNIDTSGSIPLRDISIIFIFPGIIISSFGFYFWYNKTQKYQDKILKMETWKYIFEKQYQIYELLWSVLTKLTIEIDKVIDDANLVVLNKVEDEDIFALSKEDNPFMIAAREFMIKFEENKPFIPEDVYEFADKIIDVCQHLIAKRSVTTLEIKAGLPTEFKRY